MPIALDFGTCNTVVARWNPAANRADLIPLDGLAHRFRYRQNGAEHEAPVVPSLIHYGEGGRRLLGEQVATMGLVDHPGTFRWAKLDVLNNMNHARRVGSVRKTPFEAATDVVRDILTFVLAADADARDEDLVVTAPIEAFNHYVDWLEEAVRGAFRGRVSFIDEATACIFGYQDVVRPGDAYMVVDFGGGTLDVSIVRPNPKEQRTQKCQVLGRAGDELGGSLIDRWMLEAVSHSAGLSDRDLRDVGTSLLVACENAKIELSSGADSAVVTHLNDVTGGVIRHTFTRAELSEGNPGRSSLMGILKSHDFFKRVLSVVKRALEAAHDRYGFRERDLRGVCMVGGTSLLLGVRDCVEAFISNTPVHLGDPFGSIAAGACRFLGHDLEAVTVHDYCLQTWDPVTKDFKFEVVMPKGTPFPTAGATLAKYLGAAAHDARELNLVVYERAEMARATDFVIGVGEDGRLRAQALPSAGKTQTTTRGLNEWARDFIRPDPPCGRQEKKRFIVRFGLDPEQRLLVWLEDTLEGNRSKAAIGKDEHGQDLLVPLPLKEFPLVKLGRRK